MSDVEEEEEICVKGTGDEVKGTDAEAKIADDCVNGVRADADGCGGGGAVKV